MEVSNSSTDCRIFRDELIFFYQTGPKSDRTQIALDSRRTSWWSQLLQTVLLDRTRPQLDSGRLPGPSRTLIGLHRPLIRDQTSLLTVKQEISSKGSVMVSFEPAWWADSFAPIGSSKGGLNWEQSRFKNEYIGKSALDRAKLDI